ncbi:MAG TPA: hypothetical protein VJJ21_03165 [Candidatus Nanoarchaeia archaeon]|nr:hypothetical protein [Candidatus Nanoarchaeia archaeon]
MEEYCRDAECGKVLGKDTYYDDQGRGYCNPKCRAMAALDESNLIFSLRAKGIEYLVEPNGQLVPLKEQPTRRR